MNFFKKIKDWVLLPTYGLTTKICKQCRSEIDVNAKICPNCRKKQPSRVKRIILVIFIAMVLLSMCSNSNNDNDTTKKTETSAKPTKETTETTKKGTNKPTKKPTKKPDAKKEKQTFIKSCKTYKFKDLMRNPDKYKNKKIKIKGKIEQTLDGGFLDDNKYYRVLVDSDKDRYYLENEEYYIVDKRSENKPKLLDDDVIELYGTFKGTEKLTRVLGNSDEIPKIEMKYVKLISE